LLATHYERNAALLRKTLTSLFYPALLFHMAVLIAPLQELVKTWNIVAYLAKVLVVFVPVYALVGFVVVALQGQHGERWRAMIESVLHRVPLLGKARRNLALARLASALEALTAAGVNIIEGWELAATASGSPAIGKAVVPGGPQPWRPEQRRRKCSDYHRFSPSCLRTFITPGKSPGHWTTHFADSTGSIRTTGRGSCSWWQIGRPSSFTWR
ncbi:MAG: hypothetical protein IPK15_22575, partial [Verrucomicrobia bacterium]|nr:hypothetical protein [Verrucomicrobiota bacterium]